MQSRCESGVGGQCTFIDQLAGVEGRTAGHMPERSNQFSHDSDDGYALVAAAIAGTCAKPRGDARVVFDEPQRGEVQLVAYDGGAALGDRQSTGVVATALNLEIEPAGLFESCGRCVVGEWSQVRDEHDGGQLAHGGRDVARGLLLRGLLFDAIVNVIEGNAHA